MGRQTAIPSKIVFIVALLFATPLFAQFEFLSLGGRGAAMGGTAVALDDASSAMAGIASLSGFERTEIALGVRQNFVAEGMGYAMLGGIFPIGFGAMSATVLHYGNSDYNEQQTTLAYALPLGRSVSMGVALHYLHSGTSDSYYDPINKLTFTMAVRYCPSNVLAVAFKAYNPAAVFIDRDDSQRIPSIFCLGISYRLMDELLAVSEVEKSLYQQATLRFGLEYTLQEVYFFRVGVNTQPAIYTLGFGLKLKDFTVDIAGQVHSVLGLTPQISIQYKF